MRWKCLGLDLLGERPDGESNRNLHPDGIRNTSTFCDGMGPCQWFAHVKMDIAQTFNQSVQMAKMAMQRSLSRSMGRVGIQVTTDVGLLRECRRMGVPLQVADAR